MRGQVSNPCRARRLGAPSYRLGGLFRRRKGAGDSVERLPLVFRCRLFGGGRELGTPLFDSVFAAAGTSAAQGDGEHGVPPRFFVGPDALIGPFPGGPVCRPYKGDQNLIPYPARATERVAPTSTCLKPDGRVRTPAPTANKEAGTFFA